MLHVAAIIHFVQSLEDAAKFCQEQLGWSLIQSAPSFALLDNQSIQLRLVHSDQPSPPLRLDIPVREPQIQAKELLEHSAMTLLKPLHKVTQERVELHLQGPHGFVLVLSRTYHEDELGIIPPLETSLYWEEKVIQFMQTTLKCVPPTFRKQARKRGVELAEWLAIEQGEVEVKKDHAIRGLIRSAPFLMKYVVRDELLSLGVDIGPYQNEFPDEQ